MTPNELTPCCAVLGAVAVCLASATTADAASGTALAASVKKAITTRSHVKVTRAICPVFVDARKGRTTTCTLTFASGDRSPVRVLFTSASGSYKAVLTNFLVRNLEDQLEDRFKNQGVTARVTCPTTRKVKTGDRFSCVARASDGRTQTVKIRQTGNGLARVEA